MHNDADQRNPITFRDRYKRVSGFLCPSGFSSKCTWIGIVESKHIVAVIQPPRLRLLICRRNLIGRGSRQRAKFRILHSRTRDQSHIIGACIMGWIRQAICVCKMCILRAKLLGAVVHQHGERLCTAGNMRRQHARGIICRFNHHGIFQLLYRQLFAASQCNVCGITRHLSHNLVCDSYDIARLGTLHRQKAGHNLRNACRIHLLVHIFFKQNLSRISIHQNGRFRIKLRRIEQLLRIVRKYPCWKQQRQRQRRQQRHQQPSIHDYLVVCNQLFIKII